MAELIAALDLPTQKEALALAGKLKGIVPWLKVGLELFTAAGPDIIGQLKAEGFKIFLDLKFYDIPNTVQKAVRAACAHEADLLTLHLQGGARMCEAARQAAAEANGKCLLFGVTALTSFAAGEMPGIAADPGIFGRELAANAKVWGMDGVVCSALEARDIKKANPGLLCLCPGIRLLAAGDDQRRVAAPATAVANGADFLVVGRPIYAAVNPELAAREILRQM